MSGGWGEDDVARRAWSVDGWGKFVGRTEEGGARWVEIVVLPDDELDFERADRLARQLRRELVEQDLETRAVTTKAPADSKGDVATFGAIAVALVGAGGMIPTLIAVLRDWLGHRTGPDRISIKIGDRSMELDRPTFAERQQLLEAFLTTADE